MRTSHRSTVEGIVERHHRRNMSRAMNARDALRWFIDFYKRHSELVPNQPAKS